MEKKKSVRRRCTKKVLGEIGFNFVAPISSNSLSVFFLFSLSPYTFLLLPDITKRNVPSCTRFEDADSIFWLRVPFSRTHLRRGRKFLFTLPFRFPPALSVPVSLPFCFCSSVARNGKRLNYRSNYVTTGRGR